MQCLPVLTLHPGAQPDCQWPSENAEGKFSPEKVLEIRKSVKMGKEEDKIVEALNLIT